jgi:FeS assembly SUF system protein
MNNSNNRRDIEIPSRIVKSAVIENIKTVYDPEIPVNIYELGLVYDVSVDEEGNTKILMTLTSPMCPVADILPEEVREKASMVEGVNEATVELTWNPPWTPDKMSEAAKLQLNF